MNNTNINNIGNSDTFIPGPSNAPQTFGQPHGIGPSSPNQTNLPPFTPSPLPSYIGPSQPPIGPSSAPSTNLSNYSIQHVTQNLGNMNLNQNSDSDSDSSLSN